MSDQAEYKWRIYRLESMHSGRSDIHQHGDFVTFLVNICGTEFTFRYSYKTKEAKVSSAEWAHFHAYPVSNEIIKELKRLGEVARYDSSGLCFNDFKIDTNAIVVIEESKRRF